MMNQCSWYKCTKCNHIQPGPDWRWTDNWPACDCGSEVVPWAEGPAATRVAHKESYLNGIPCTTVTRLGAECHFMKDDDGEPVLTGVFSGGERLNQNAPEAVWNTAREVLAGMQPVDS